MVEKQQYRRPKPLEQLSGRTRDGKFLKRKRAEFTAHVGGVPSPVQRTLIDRAAWLSLYVARMDAKLADDRDLSEHDQRQYLAWTNTLARTVARLGAASPAKAPSLRERLMAQSGTAA